MFSPALLRLTTARHMLSQGFPPSSTGIRSCFQSNLRSRSESNFKIGLKTVGTTTQSPPHHSLSVCDHHSECNVRFRKKGQMPPSGCPDTHSGGAPDTPVTPPPPQAFAPSDGAPPRPRPGPSLRSARSLRSPSSLRTLSAPWVWYSSISASPRRT